MTWFAKKVGWFGKKVGCFTQKVDQFTSDLIFSFLQKNKKEQPFRIVLSLNILTHSMPPMLFLLQVFAETIHIGQGMQ
jgi:hypothetical protein